jgi:MoaA/NifB/PqqE/SkfB family radical SAM enzyme
LSRAGAVSTATARVHASLRRYGAYGAFLFDTFVLRRQRPFLLGMVITDRCNLACYYCESKNQQRIHFRYEQATRTLDEAYSRGHRTLYFTGGEPLLWNDGDRRLAELVLFARERGFLDVFVFTNGTFPLDIPDCSYIVTIDGPRAAHDAVRGGTYERVLENVRQAASRNVFASMTFTRENEHHLEALVQEIVATGLFCGISFNLLTHWPEIVALHGLDRGAREQLLDRLWQLKRRGLPIVLSRAAYLAMRRNDWKRPIPQIELATSERVFTCCRDVEHPAICDSCGYSNCVEVSQMLALRPSAVWQAWRMTRLG